MTDPVVVAIISGSFGTITAAITTAGLLISRKARDAAQAAAAQAIQNGAISVANHETLTKVVQNTDGNVRKLQEAWAAEARRRETEAWNAAFEAGRRAEMEKKRRVTDLPELVNDEEPKE